VAETKGGGRGLVVKISELVGGGGEGGCCSWAGELGGLGEGL
jgi:hypothetical protein